MLERCNCNKILLNPSKSEFKNVKIIILGACPEVFIRSDLIKEFSSFEYLGVRNDTRLKYDFEVEITKSMLCQLCGVSFRLSNFINYETDEKVYNSC